MRKLLLIGVLGGIASAAPALYQRIPFTSLPFCKANACQQVKRYAANDLLMGRFIHTEYKLNGGRSLTTAYGTDGRLYTTELTMRRTPLDESDKAVALALIQAVTGSQYTKAMLEACFSEAQNTAEMYAPETGAVGFAGGKTAEGVPWGSQCHTYRKPNELINRLNVSFAFQ